LWERRIGVWDAEIVDYLPFSEWAKIKHFCNLIYDYVLIFSTITQEKILEYLNNLVIPIGYEHSLFIIWLARKMHKFHILDTANPLIRAAR
jgi:hypothetical protein